MSQGGDGVYCGNLPLRCLSPRPPVADSHILSKAFAMAAPSKKPEAIHFIAIVLAMIAAVCGGGWYYVFKEMRTVQGQLKTANEGKSVADAAATRSNQDVQELKQLLGNAQPEVGTMADPSKANTVISDIVNLIRRTGSLAAENNPAAAQHVTSALNDFATRFATQDAELKKLRKDKEDLERCPAGGQRAEPGPCRRSPDLQDQERSRPAAEHHAVGRAAEGQGPGPDPGG